ncbi:hypothetical protein VPNG_09301 [Cytospora leucostoma]|uniref:Uncharacterized protein n=1 Tax=Cytospora leucostoma TaxID=1230097 RepID=A0A423VV03_9PEZI|nr:hypothetical protein VPNG_09301 [Cytospora leucostoma]
MTLDINHHCPACGKKGNQRCVKLRHIFECDTHKGRFHSKYNECVACVEARVRNEKAKRRSEDSQTAQSEKNRPRKTEKKSKMKRPHERTMKQMRQEKREDRESSTA